jgi:hypothetical protein
MGEKSNFFNHLTNSHKSFSRCISFFLQSNPDMSINHLYNQAFGQFLLADLREVGIPTLPDMIESKNEQWILNGKFTVQMQCLMDICKYYSKNNLDNSVDNNNTFS